MKKDSLSKNICVSAGETKNEEARRALVPRLRFPEFRGDEGWSQQGLGVIAEILKGKGISKADLDHNGSQACIRYGELYTRYGETIREAVSRTNISASELFLSKPGDVIIPSSGETKIDIAKASCVLSGGIALGGDLNVIRSKINGTFLSYYLNGPKRQDIAKVAQGDTVVHLYPHQLEALLIAVPSLAEQQRIAECLSSLDELIAAQARKVNALKTHKKGLMQQLFPREGETQPRLRFPEFRDAGEWKPTSFGELRLDVTDGNYSSKYPSQSDFVANGVPFLRANNLKFGTILDDDMRFISKEQHSQITKGHLKQGDILITTRGELGTVAIVPDRHIGSNINAQIVRINSGNILVNTFLFQLLDYSRSRGLFDALSTGTALKQLPIGKLNQLALRIPEIHEEQQRIAECLSSLDALIAAETKKLEVLKAHKKGLMQQVFPSPENIEA